MGETLLWGALSVSCTLASILLPANAGLPLGLLKKERTSAGCLSALAHSASHSQLVRWKYHLDFIDETKEILIVFSFKVTPCRCCSQCLNWGVGLGLCGECSSGVISSKTQLRSGSKGAHCGNVLDGKSPDSLSYLNRAWKRQKLSLSPVGKNAICLLKSFAQILVWVQADGV